VGAAAPATAVKQGLKWSVHALDRLRPTPRGVTVLIYHRVGGRTPLDVDLPRATFAAQMAELATSGRVRSIDDALDALDGPAPATAADDPVVITFDDGTADFADEAMPVLEQYRLPATIYVATDFVDRGVDFPGDGRPLSWSALRDVAASGLVTVGSHTHTHALLDRLPVAVVDDELDRADALLTEHLGGPIRHFAYPKAVAGSSPADAAVRRRYRSAALAGTRPNPYGTTDPYRLARSPIQTSDGMRFFAAKLAGGMHLEDALRDTANRWRYRGRTG
jgi:peptidoglycan/xylan/chitin deacetylase (PgdA/CDA1 family)